MPVTEKRREEVIFMLELYSIPCNPSVDNLKQCVSVTSEPAHWSGDTPGSCLALPQGAELYCSGMKNVYTVYNPWSKDHM